jgi:cobalt-zinc-cadmium efflux system outer membrane protein
LFTVFRKGENVSFTSKVAAFAVLAWAWSGQAAEPSKLPDLIAEALGSNPEVQAAQKNYEAARQRPSRESSLPDPTLSLGYSSNGGPLPGQQLGSNPTSNIGFMVSQQIPYPGKRKLRGDMAAKDAEAEFWQYQAVELNVRSRLTQAFHRLHHTYAGLEILAHGKEVLTEMLRVSEARYAAGKTAQQDIFKAQTQLSMMETRIIRMQQDQRVTEAEINSLLNRKPGSPLGEPANNDPTALPMTLDELLAKAAGTSPELERRKKMIARGELGVNLARKEFHPDYTVSAGYFNQGSMSPMYQVRVDIPLRIHEEHNQRPALNEQVDLLTAARRGFEAAEQGLQFRVREAWIAAETAWRLMQLYTDTILPQSQLTVDSSLTAYQTGGTDFVAVLNNLATKVDVEEQLHEKEMDYELAVARLEEMTGVDLSGVEGGRTK